VVRLPENSGIPAFVAQRIEHLTTDQKVGGSSPSKRTGVCAFENDHFSPKHLMENLHGER
jgi:hypothetical protein